MWAGGEHEEGVPGLPWGLTAPAQEEGSSAAVAVVLGVCEGPRQQEQWRWVLAEHEERESQPHVSLNMALHPVLGQWGAELPPDHYGR